MILCKAVKLVLYSIWHPGCIAYLVYKLGRYVQLYYLYYHEAKHVIRKQPCCYAESYEPRGLPCSRYIRGKGVYLLLSLIWY